MGSQASQYGFGTPLNRVRRGTFISSYDPAIRLKAGPDFTGRVCPDGHMCRLMEYKNSNRSCDDCKTEIDAGAVGERCLQCEFDLCPGCSTGSAAAPSTHVGAHVSADASAPLDSVLTDAAPSLPDYDEVSSVSLLPEKMYSIFLPPKSSIGACLLSW